MRGMENIIWRILGWLWGRCEVDEILAVKEVLRCFFNEVKCSLKKDDVFSLHKKIYHGKKLNETTYRINNDFNIFGL